MSRPRWLDDWPGPFLLAEAELPHSGQVLLHRGRSGELLVGHPEDVDLVDVVEAPAGGWVAHPLPEVGARAPEVRDHLFVFGDEVDDLHREVGEGIPEWADPVPCGQGKLAVGYLVQYIKVAVVDRLNQAADKEFVVLGGRGRPLDDTRRADVLHDAGDLSGSLGAWYAVGPDVGTMNGQRASRLISGEGPAGRLA